MIDPDFDPIIPPRYYDGYIASPDSKYSSITGSYIRTGTWTVYTYPHIVIWQFDTEAEARQYADELNELDRLIDDEYIAEDE
jgi:hypothetical protein